MSHYSQPPPPANAYAAPPGTWVTGFPTPPPYTDQRPVPSGAHQYPYSSFSSSSSSSHHSGNPYVQVTPAPPSASRSTSTDTLWKVLGRAGKVLEDTTRKAADVTGNVWTHLKTGNNLTDAAMSRLSKETKSFAEGGREKLFQQTFGIIPGEQLLKTYACYLSTSGGPVIGTLYLSTLRLAFCSDNPHCHSPSPGHQEWMHYKVVIQLPQLKSVNPSANRTNPAEKYIQIFTADGHEFWFMGFVNYDKALKNLVEALQRQSVYY